MALRIPKDSLDEIAEEIIKKNPKKRNDKLHFMNDALEIVARSFFWLPTYKMLLEAGLFDKNLIPNDFMIAKGFTFNWNKYSGVESGITGERFCITTTGIHFLGTLINNVHWENLHHAPPGSLCIKLTDGKYKTKK